MSGSHVIDLSTAWCPPPATAPGPWLRRFGRPSGLEPGDVVWLVIESPMGCGTVLNGFRLPPAPAGGAARHDVTRLLGARNELELALSEAAAGTGTAGPLPGHGRCPLPTAVGSVTLVIESGTVISTKPA